VITRARIEELIRRLYQEVGGRPADLIQIRPIDGGWENALSYDISHRDGRKIRIFRKALDDDNEQEVRNALGALM